MTLCFTGAFSYRHDWIKELCHAVKKGWPRAIREEARRLCHFLQPWTLLVPVPGHGGRATVTKNLAKRLSVEAFRRGKPVLVADVLACEPHESLCALKRKGYWPVRNDVTMRWRSGAARALTVLLRRLGWQVVLLDNVLDSGVTAAACCRVLGETCLLATGYTDGWKRNPDIEYVTRLSKARIKNTTKK